MLKPGLRAESSFPTRSSFASLSFERGVLTAHLAGPTAAEREAMILSRDGPLRFDLSRFDLARSMTSPTDAASSRTADSAVAPLDVVVANHIKKALERTHYKIHGAGGAGELLGINPNTLRAKMRKHGIPFRGGKK